MASKWTEVGKNFWSYETTLMCVSVVQARGSKRWKIIVTGRNLWETRPASQNLPIAKSTATRFAKGFVRAVLEDI